MTESRQLLAEYANNGSEAAFRELVARYINFVYSTALRLVERNTQLAEEVTQTVFIDLSRMSKTLSTDIMLGGWLHQHTFHVATKAARGELRRQAREREASEMNMLQNSLPKAPPTPLPPLRAQNQFLHQLASSQEVRAAFCLLHSPRGGFGGRIPFSDFCLRFGVGCISIRNAENGRLRTRGTMVAVWYHHGPAMVP